MKPNDKIVLFDGVGSENNGSRERQLSIVTEQGQVSDVPDRDKMQSELVKNVCCDTIYFLKKLVKIADELKKHANDSSDYKNILKCEGSAICEVIGEYYLVIAEKNRPWIAADLYEKWTVAGNKYIKYTIDDFIRSSGNRSNIEMLYSDSMSKVTYNKEENDLNELRRDKEILVEYIEELLKDKKYFQGLTVKQSAQIATLKKINVEQTAEIASLEKLYYKNPDNHEIAGLGENPQEALGYDCI